MGKEERDLAGHPSPPPERLERKCQEPRGSDAGDNTEGRGIASLFRGVIFMIHGFVQVIGGWL